jgi:hypothetical protein
MSDHDRNRLYPLVRRWRSLIRLARAFVPLLFVLTGLVSIVTGIVHWYTTGELVGIVLEVVGLIALQVATLGQEPKPQAIDIDVVSSLRTQLEGERKLSKLLLAEVEKAKGGVHGGPAA